jgi:hypothetical protein
MAQGWRVEQLGDQIRASRPGKPTQVFPLPEDLIAYEPDAKKPEGRPRTAFADEAALSTLRAAIARHEVAGEDLETATRNAMTEVGWWRRPSLLRLRLMTAAYMAKGKRPAAALRLAMISLNWPDRSPREIERLRGLFRRRFNF